MFSQELYNDSLSIKVQKDFFFNLLINKVLNKRINETNLLKREMDGLIVYKVDGDTVEFLLYNNFIWKYLY